MILELNSNNLREFNQHMTKVEIELKNITTKFGNMKNMLKKIFAAVLGGGQVNNVSATSINNNNIRF